MTRSKAKTKAQLRTITVRRRAIVIMLMAFVTFAVVENVFEGDVGMQAFIGIISALVIARLSVYWYQKDITAKRSENESLQAQLDDKNPEQPWLERLSTPSFFRRGLKPVPATDRPQRPSKWKPVPRARRPQHN